MRIVSLLPSATEIICALGLEQHLAGVTHECDYPEFVKDLPKVTRTLIPTDASSAEIDRLVRERLHSSRALYTLDLFVLRDLRPDLIVTQTLCDVCAVAEAEVREAACTLPGGVRVIHLEPVTLGEVLHSMTQVAEAAAAAGAAGAIERGEAAIADLQARINAVVERSGSAGRSFSRRDQGRDQGEAHQASQPTRQATRPTRQATRQDETNAPRPSVALLEWLDPPFSCGHWNPELVRMAGGIECLGREGQPSRTLTWDEVREAAPEIILIACCGFSTERTLQDVQRLPSLPAWNDLPAVRSGRVYVADGSAYFSRPGPRLVDSLEILAHAIDPALHPIPKHPAIPIAKADPRSL